ncbi:head maturation protease, ClpP-related, partial [Clostridium botulinum]
MTYVDVKGEVVSSGSEWIYSWYGIQAVSPSIIQKALNNANGQPITVRINSGGGDVFAGCEIYNMLKNHNGDVSIEIHGLCASIASVIAMAGKCKMSPLAEIMIHNVSTKAQGDYRDMEHTAEVLKKANKTISNAYTLKTGM